MIDNATMLADVRGQSVDDIRRRFTDQEIASAPKSFTKHLTALRGTDFNATGTENGLAWVRLDSGRIFYSPMTHPALRRQYPYVSDLLSPSITEDSFLAAIDVVQRYLTDFTWPPADILPASGDAKIIELGAYLGHKTIRFADELARHGGKVLAVEMMPENCDILRRNITANGLEGIVDVLPVGVWNEPGTITGFSKGRQRNSILPIDKLEDGERFETATWTLDQIIENWEISPIDLVFVTVNGVEVQALEGFSPQNDVRAFFVAAPYVNVDDKKISNADACRSVLSGYGYDLLDVGNHNRVVAVRRDAP